MVMRAISTDNGNYMSLPLICDKPDMVAFIEFITVDRLFIPSLVLYLSRQGAERAPILTNALTVVVGEGTISHLCPQTKWLPCNCLNLPACTYLRTWLTQGVSQSVGDSQVWRSPPGLPEIRNPPSQPLLWHLHRGGEVLIS